MTVVLLYVRQHVAVDAAGRLRLMLATPSIWLAAVGAAVLQPLAPRYRSGSGGGGGGHGLFTYSSGALASTTLFAVKIDSTSATSGTDATYWQNTSAVSPYQRAWPVRLVRPQPWRQRGCGHDQPGPALLFIHCRKISLVVWAVILPQSQRVPAGAAVPVAHPAQAATAVHAPLLHSVVVVAAPVMAAPLLLMQVVLTALRAAAAAVPVDLWHAHRR